DPEERPDVRDHAWMSGGRPDPSLARLGVREILEPAPRHRDPGPRLVELDACGLGPGVPPDHGSDHARLDVDGVCARDRALEADRRARLDGVAAGPGHGEPGARDRGLTGPAGAAGPAPEEIEETGPRHAPTLGRSAPAVKAPLGSAPRFGRRRSAYGTILDSF